MKVSVCKKALCATALCAAIILSQSFIPKNDEEKPTNLKVLSKKLGGEEVLKIMKVYSKSLGVRCGYCHVAKEGKPPKMDFASDLKPEKETARKMIKMTADINRKYIDKIGDHHFEKITCVTCHMGNVKPIADVDSLAKKQ